VKGTSRKLARLDQRFSGWHHGTPGLLKRQFLKIGAIWILGGVVTIMGLAPLTFSRVQEKVTTFSQRDQSIDMNMHHHWCLN
jgi:hypothetical protein